VPKKFFEEKGGVFHVGSFADHADLETGKIHFFYQPDLSRAEEILPQTDQGQYDALIAAATFFPKESVFHSGGVRIGAGTGNMGSASWGGLFFLKNLCFIPEESESEPEPEIWAVPLGAAGTEPAVLRR